MRHFAALFLIFTLIPFTAAGQIKLPDLGDPEASTLSLSEEMSLGQAFWQQLNASTLVEEDLIISFYLQQVGRRLVGEQRRSGFHFFPIKDKSINAFALPGGYIGIHEGLILASNSEDELASVMAHEIAHVRGRHIARMIHYSNNVSMTSMVGMVAGALVSAANPIVGSSIFTSAMAGGQQSLINFTRQQEKEADNVGMQILQQAGYNPKAMAIFFETLLKQNRHQENPAIDYLRTHPLTESRLISAQERAQYFDTQRPFENSQGFQITKARLTYAQLGSPRRALRYFAQQHDAHPQHIGIQYGLAMAYSDLNEPEQAEAVLAKGIFDQTPWGTLLQAQLSWQKGQPEQAIKSLTALSQEWPRDLPTHLSLAQMQLDNSSPDQAEQTLRPLKRHFKKAPELYRALSQVFAAQSKYYDAHLAQADFLYLRGFLEQALLQLNQAREWTEASDFKNEQLAQREAQIKRALNRQNQLGIL